MCVHGCTFECQGLEEGSLLLRSCHVSLSSGAHPAWQPHTHSGASSTRRLEETPRLCAMNGSLLTLCFPHHDGLIMTDLNCVGLDVCVCVCFWVKWKKEEKNEKKIDRSSDTKALMCVHVQHVHSVCASVCVCVLRGYSHLLECWSVSTGCFFSVNTFGRMSLYSERTGLLQFQGKHWGAYVIIH